MAKRKHTPSTPQTALSIEQIPIDRLKPNAWNPNRMGDDEYQELVAEIRHLGRLPKPVVVRRNGDGYEIVDGEHGWRAAQECGLKDLPCEVIEVDDFEAMRQTYKRNQHGIHNKVLEGRMFREMMKQRRLNNSTLAKELELSEGTIRNSLQYAEAADRGDPDKIARLNVRQVRFFNTLPPKLGQLWLECGGDLQAVHTVDGESRWSPLVLSGLEDADYFPYLKDAKYTQDGFRDALQKMLDWYRWEKRWCIGGMRISDVRPYTHHYLRARWHVRERHLMDYALGNIVDVQNEKFLLTPDEFESLLDILREQQSSAQDFERMLQAAVLKRHGSIPENPYSADHELMEAMIARFAPDFIRDSQLPLEEKNSLFDEFTSAQDWLNDPRCNASDPGLGKLGPEIQRFHTDRSYAVMAAIRTIATWKGIDGSDKLPPHKRVRAVIDEVIRLAEEQQGKEQHVMGRIRQGQGGVIREITARLYPDSVDAERSAQLANALVSVTVPALMALADALDDLCWRDELAAAKTRHVYDRLCGGNS